jgi:hypothetical protein
MLLVKRGSLKNFDELQPPSRLNHPNSTGKADSPQFVGAEQKSLLKGAAGDFKR